MDLTRRKCGECSCRGIRKIAGVILVTELLGYHCPIHKVFRSLDIS